MTSIERRVRKIKSNEYMLEADSDTKKGDLYYLSKFHHDNKLSNTQLDNSHRIILDRAHIYTSVEANDRQRTQRAVQTVFNGLEMFNVYLARGNHTQYKSWDCLNSVRIPPLRPLYIRYNHKPREKYRARVTYDLTAHYPYLVSNTGEINFTWEKWTEFIMNNRGFYNTILHDCARGQHSYIRNIASSNIQCLIRSNPGDLVGFKITCPLCGVPVKYLLKLRTSLDRGLYISNTENVIKLSSGHYTFYRSTGYQYNNYLYRNEELTGNRSIVRGDELASIVFGPGAIRYAISNNIPIEVINS